MGGAYVAKPAVVVDLGLPPGWSLIWPFPGAYPPGYEPDLSFELTAPSAMVPGTVVTNIDLTLFDQEVFPTREPQQKILFSATWKNPGEIVKLKLSGDPAFVSVVEMEYEDVGDDFWGSAPEFEFDVDANDLEETIILLATSNPLGQPEIRQTVEILVAAILPWTATFRGVTTYPAVPSPTPPYVSRSLGIKGWFHKEGVGYWVEPYAYVYNWGGQVYSPLSWSLSHRSQPADVYDLYLSEDDGSEWIISSKELDGSFMIAASRLKEEGEEENIYEIELDQFDSVRISATYTYTFRTYRAGILQETYTKVRVIAEGQPGVKEEWLEIDGETGEVTVINP